MIYPGATWATRTPEAAGLQSSALDEFRDATGDLNGFIVKDGYKVYGWGSDSKEIEWASAAKPVYSTMALFALQEGRLASLDEPIADYGWSSELRADDLTLSFRHLANNMSGYALPETPGQAWGYNDYAIKLYTKTLFEEVFDDASANATATDPNRLGDLDFQDGAILDSTVAVRKDVGLATSVRDFARIGWLWLNEGEWDGKQLLPASYFDTYFKAQVPADLPRTSGSPVDDYLNMRPDGAGADQTPLGPGVYGMNLWFNTNGQMWPDAPIDTFQANGHWNREVLTVIPSLNMVAAWNAPSIGNPNTFNVAMNDLLRKLVAAADDSPPPPTGDLPTLSAGRIEAEAMKLDGYIIESRAVSSGGKHVKTLGEGSGTFVFTGADGVYEIAVAHNDENDGAGTGRFFIDGAQTSTWRFDKNSGWNEHVFTATIASGDVLQVATTKQGGEYGRVDYVEVRSDDGSSPPPPPPSTDPPPSNEEPPPSSGDLPTLSGGRIEAEAMKLDGYTVESRAASSGGKHVKTFSEGSGKFVFTGDTGDHQIAVRYNDENDGAGSGRISVDGAQVSTWQFNGNNGWGEQVFAASLDAGDVIEVSTRQQGGEYGRVDYVEVRTDDGSSPPSPPPSTEPPPSNEEPPPSSGDLPTLSGGRIEAEAMKLDGYSVESRAASSGGKHVKTFSEGSGKFVFTGDTGDHQIVVRYNDESDGAGSGTVLVDDAEVSAWPFDKSTGWGQRVFTASLDSGDVIEVSTRQQGGEYGRIDYVEII
ncbi:MAG: hypothetical protein IPM60_07215 [Rhodospirillales bacterium]|nr:hypothetical protein [Rhodospirillales bacterium]